MIDWQQQRGWIALLILACIVNIGNAPLLGVALEKAVHHLKEQRSEQVTANQALTLLQEDIAAVEKMRTQIDADAAERYLAPTDRLRAGNILERRASEFRLSHLTYTIAPEQKTIVEPMGADRQVLANSPWSLSADAPSDVDVYAFLDAVKHTMPGRFTIKQMTLERTGPTEAPVTTANIRLQARGEWLSNGAPSTMTEPTP